MNKEHWEQKKCPQYDCRKKQCECGLEKVFLSAALGDDSKDSPVAPKNGEYCNAIVVYEANGHIYIYSQEGIPTLVESEGTNVEEIIEQLERRLSQEVLDRQAADNVLQGEIDDIKNSPDVVDIVATYAALQAYDTSKLGDNDIVRVLQDETHDGQSTYYRWNKQSSTWTYIGAVGDYYTKGQVDTLLADKQDELTAGANISIAQVDNDLVISATNTTYTAGTNVSISSGNVISATDTTYSDFTGTDGITDGAAGLVPAPLVADANKFLKSDGTWEAAGGGITILTTSDYNYPTNDPFAVSPGLLPSGFYQVANDNVFLLFSSTTKNWKHVLLYVTEEDYNGSKWCYQFNSRGDASNTADQSAKINVWCYNPSTGAYVAGNSKSVLDATWINNTLAFPYAGSRVLDAYQGKVLKDTIDGLVIKGSGAPTTSTAGTVGKLYEDTTNGKLYQCTAVSGSTYTWTEIGAGGGGPTVVQTTGTSTTNVMSQDATTKLVYPDIANSPYKMVIGEGSIAGTNKGLAINGILNTGITGGSVVIGATDASYAQVGTQGRADNSVAIGNNAHVARGFQSIAIGANSFANSGQNTGNNVAIGFNANAGAGSATSTVALGAYASANRAGEVNIGTGSNGTGYNSTNYRVLGGVHDGQLAQDAATVAQVNATIDAINTALNTNIPHIGA